MHIIGITGYKRTGKDTVCRAIQDFLSPNQVFRVGFADALKEEISKAIGMPVEYIEKHKNHFRLILQGWGTDYRRNLCGSDYWIERWQRKVLDLPDCYAVVCPDVRFLNEAKAITDVGGKIIMVMRDGFASDGHESEQDMDRIGVDAVILNTGTLTELKLQTKKALQTINTWPTTFQTH